MIGQYIEAMDAVELEHLLNEHALLPPEILTSFDHGRETWRDVQDKFDLKDHESSEDGEILADDTTEGSEALHDILLGLATPSY